MNQTCGCGKPTSGAWLCDDCTKTFRYALANVAAYHDDLGTVERKQTRYNDSTPTKSATGRTIPAPADLRFAGIKEPGNQLKYDAWRTVAEWTKEVMANNPRRYGPTCTTCIHVMCSAIRRSRWPRNTVPSMVNYLARHFAHITTQEWAPTMFDEFLDLERRLTRMVNRPADKWYAGRCGFTETELEAAIHGRAPITCETELYATADKGTIACPGCGIEHDVAERREFLLKEAKECMVTASEAAAALIAWTDYDGTTKKLIDLIAYWRGNDALEDHGVTEVNGQWRKTYRLGDVQDRLIEHAQREQQRRLRAS